MTTARDTNIHELRNRARDALELHNGNLERATAMLSHLVTRRVYLLDAMVMDYLSRIQIEPSHEL